MKTEYKVVVNAAVEFTTFEIGEAVKQAKVHARRRVGPVMVTETVTRPLAVIEWRTLPPDQKLTRGKKGMTIRMLDQYGRG